jgi:Glycine zipper 2TM domain
MKKSILAFAAASLVVPAGAVLADPPAHAPAHGYYKGKKHKRGYREPQYIRNDTRLWRGDDGRYYCRRDDGTTGLIIGAAVGGLAGNEIAGRGDKTLGAILGAAGGALLGREIDRGDYRCR